MNRLYFEVFLMELRKTLAYRADFWLNFVGQTVFALLIAYFLWDAIFEAKNAVVIKGYTLPDMIFYYLMAPIIFRSLQGQNIGFISREIYDGELNKYLLYPINFFKFKVATYFSHSFFYALQAIALLLIGLAFLKAPMLADVTMASTVAFLIYLIMSCLCYCYLTTIAELISFWADNVWSLIVLTRFSVSFLGGALIPLDFFPDFLKDLLYWTPFPHFIFTPIQILRGNLTIRELLATLLILFAWVLLFRLISKIIWKRGLYQYSGVGI